MYHTSRDGGVKVVVLKACMRAPWSEDGGGEVYVVAGGGAIMDGPGTLGVHVRGGVEVPGGQGRGEGAPYDHGGEGDRMAGCT
jgi:hypothetical protein